MLRSLSNNELMMVNGGYYYVPMYKNGVFIRETQVSNWSNIRCYKWEGGRWVPYYFGS